MTAQFPNLRLVIYFDLTAPESVVVALSRYPHVTLVRVDSPWAGVGTRGALYRFLGFLDYSDAGTVVCTWDLDNQLTHPFFRQLIEYVDHSNSTFFVLKKSDPPRARLFNADCWVAVPERNATYHSFSEELYQRMLVFLRESDDVEYGCDERFQTQLVRHFLRYNRPDRKLIHMYPQCLSTKLTGKSIDYEESQRGDYILRHAGPDCSGYAIAARHLSLRVTTL